jgi:hypothetical protein
MKALFLCCCLALTAPRAGLAAERYALLIGIGEYSMTTAVRPLQGPRHDLEAMLAVCTSLGYRAGNVTVLQDRQATRAAIVAAFEQLAARVRPGDDVLIYYSGHGTSPQDPAWRVPLPVDADTGALIPADYQQGRTPQENAARLVVGRRDLRPSLEKMDAVATVFALFDTCFSQNLARDVVTKHRGSPRSPSLADDYASDIAAAQTQAPSPPYPYKNVAWISAALAGQQALDLDAETLKDNPKATFDGQPHGQFTNAVVEGLMGAADLNGDGIVTHKELFEYLSGRATREQWSHQPALSADDSRPEVLNLPFSGNVASAPSAPRVAVKPAPASASPAAKVRVEVDPEIPPAFRARVAALAAVQIVEGGAQLTVRREGRGYQIYQAGGLPISDEPFEEAEALDRLRVDARLRALMGIAYLRQTASIDLSLRDLRNGQRLRQGVLFPGNRFSMVARSDRPVWPLVLDIDKTGFVTVLYPVAGQQAEAVRGEVNLGAQGIQCPCGLEQFKVLLFDNPPAGYAQWAGKSFAADSPLLDSLLGLAKQGSGEGSYHFLTNALPGAGR